MPCVDAHAVLLVEAAALHPEKIDSIVPNVSSYSNLFSPHELAQFLIHRKWGMVVSINVPYCALERGWFQFGSMVVSATC